MSDKWYFGPMAMSAKTREKPHTQSGQSQKYIYIYLTTQDLIHYSTDKIQIIKLACFSSIQV